MSEATTTATTESTDGETSLGLNENLLGVLAYFFSLISGIAILVLENKSEFARFHAAQSILFSLVAFPLFIAIGIFQGVLAAAGVPAMGIIALVLNLAFLVLWLFLMFKTFQGERFKLPVIGSIAENKLA